MGSDLPRQDECRGRDGQLVLSKGICPTNKRARCAGGLHAGRAPAGSGAVIPRRTDCTKCRAALVGEMAYTSTDGAYVPTMTNQRVAAATTSTNDTSADTAQSLVHTSLTPPPLPPHRTQRIGL